MGAWWMHPGVLEQVAREVTAWGAGARCQQVKSGADARIALEFHRTGDTRVLWLDAETPRITLLSTSPPRDPGEPPAFQGLLRKHLVNARLESLSVEGPAAAMHLRMQTLSGVMDVVVEWTRAARNLLLVGPHGKVMGAAVPSRLKARSLRMGQPWVAAIREPVMDGEGSVPSGPHPPGDWKGLETCARVAVTLQEVAEAAGTAPPRDPELRKRVKKEIGRAQRLVDALEADVARTSEQQSARAAAERAKVQMAELVRGVDRWVLRDPYDADAPPVEVRVDPARSVQANVEQLFNRVRRMKRTAEMVGPRLVEARRRVETLTDVLRALDAAEDGAETRARAAVGEHRDRGAAEGGGPARRMPFRAYRTPQGWRVLVGKSRTENDQLTHRTARGRDVFLHARDVPGSHVILVVEGATEVPSMALQHAALLAAHHSDARSEPVVSVRWTEVKHVRPVPGTPGLVTLARERVLRVRTDDPVLRDMLAHEEGADSRMGHAGAPPHR